MFDDARSKKIVLVSHCLLNQNSISDGTADLPSQFNQVVDILVNHNIGIVQMPCPELTCLGLDRGDERGAQRPLLEENTRIRALLCEPENLETLRQMADGLVRQVEQYQQHGFEVVGVIGVNRSPSCGVETTSKDGAEAPGKGVFMQILLETISNRGITLPATGTKTQQPEASVENVRRLLD